MKQIVVRKGFSYFYTNSEEIDSGAIDEKLSALEIELEQVFQKFGFIKASGYTSFYGLEKYSVTNCVDCGSLMVNRDKNPAGFGVNELNTELEFVFRDGGNFNGKELCDECLPSTHRWGLSS